MEAGLLKATYVPHIDIADAEHPGAAPDLCDLLGRRLGLLDTAADNAGIGSEMDERTGLSTADGSCSARDEQDAVGWDELLVDGAIAYAVGCKSPPTRTKDAVSPGIAEILRLWDGHYVNCNCIRSLKGPKGREVIAVAMQARCKMRECGGCSNDDHGAMLGR